ncbi:hypothetical protein MPER_04593, partial [Moniliophthora perniciosa FA553]
MWRWSTKTLRWSPIVLWQSLTAQLRMMLSTDISFRKVTSVYLVPSGMLIFVHTTRAITRDPTTYPDPESFIPERFLNEDGTPNNDDMSLVFGFGRRICPGRHVANATTWLAIASLLTLFDIQKTKDTEQSLDFDKLFSDGLV